MKGDDLRTMLATYYTLSKENAPTPETKVKRVYVNETKEVLVFGKQKHANGGGGNNKVVMVQT